MTLILINRNDNDYKLAFETYKDIYNNIMVVGKGDLQPRSLFGNPIQLDSTNYESLLTLSVDNMIEFTDYYVNAKVDGKRYMLLISNTEENSKEKARKMFFMDGKMDFYKLDQTPIIKNIDKCLIDGEIVENKDGTVFFFAFDMLYGPMEPKTVEKYVQSDSWQNPEMHAAHVVTFEHGNSAPMVGPKALDRWPSHRRLEALNAINFNYYDTNVLKLIISPSYKLSSIISENSEKTYSDTKKEFLSKIKSDLQTLYRYNLNEKDLDFDGLILTPVYSTYVVGPWNYCNYIQYKWKPKSELTIDFMLGKEVMIDEERYFYAQVKNRGNVEDFVYEDKQVVVSWNPDLKSGQIVETEFRTIKGDIIVYKFVLHRPDKRDPNSILTAKSTLNTLTFKYNKINDILDFVYYVKNLPSKDKKELRNFFSTIDDDKMKKFIIMKDPMEFFSNSDITELVKMIDYTKNNKNHELEVQLKFDTNVKQVKNCIMTIMENYGSRYEPVPVVRGYDEKDPFKRTEFAYLGTNVLIPGHQEYKKSIKKMTFTNELFNAMYEINLSEEKKINQEMKFNKFVYQLRNVISGVSKFWKLELIEFATGSTVEEAKENINNQSKLRVEIEYDPGTFIKELFNWDDDTIKTFLFDLFKKDQDEDILFESINKILETEASKANFLNRYLSDLHSKKAELAVSDLGFILSKILYSVKLEKKVDRPERFQRAERSKPQVSERKVERVKSERPQREESKSIWNNMKKFHNEIKENLYAQLVASSESKVLFDTSVGHGNDMFKWYKNGITTVFGIDVDPEQIKIANERYKNAKLKGTDYVFRVGDILDFDTDEFQGEYDFVVSNFTMHYFFEKRSGRYPNVDEFVKKVSLLLKEGGIFAGTTLLGDKMKTLINNSRPNNQYDIKWIDERSNKYSYQLKDIDTNEMLYAQHQSSIEYLVDFKYLEEQCQNNGMSLVKFTKFEDIYKKFNKYELNDVQKQISFLNAYFIFQKL
jgi:cyclopropane fatty-acyl-phospholipid synthase-like methyltransferase